MAKVSPEQDPLRNPEPESESTPTILIVENDLGTTNLIIITIQRKLASRRINLLSVVTTKEADQILADTEKPIDLILLNIFLPGENGLSWLERLRDTSLANIPVIIISAADMPLSLEPNLEEQKTGFLAKPFSPVDLVAKIETFLGE